MKQITIPADIEFELDGKKHTLEFKKMIGGILDISDVFGTRAGARRAVSIERIFRDSASVANLEDGDWELLKQAVGTFKWIPSAAREMEKAGWFTLIEEAK